MPLAAISPVYCTNTDVAALLSPAGLTARVDDDNNGYLTKQEQSWLSNAIQWATAKLNWYLLSKYDAQWLATSWIVNQWCVVCAAYWLSVRRGNPAPGSYDDLYKAAIEDVKLVWQGKHLLYEIAERDPAWPTWSNIRVDMLYAVRKNRVERPLSEETPAQGYTQQIDIVSNFIIEPNG